MTDYLVAKKFKPFLYTIDFIGNILFFWTKFKKFDKSKVKKILVIRLDHLGDVVLTTPAIKSLKNEFKDAKIDVLVRPFAKELLLNNKNISEVIMLNPPWFAREKTSFANLFKFISKNFRKYDLVIDFHADPRNILLAYFLGKFRLGSDVRGLGFLLNKISDYKTDVHVIDRMNNMLAPLGVKRSYSEPELFLTRKETDFADRFFRKNKIRKAIIINVGTGRKNKYWFNDRWAKVADELIKQKKATIVFTGSHSDLADIEEVIEKMEEKKFIVLAGNAGLNQTAAVIAKSSLFIGPDTGPMHIARAVKTPLIGLFGPVNPKIWGYDEKKYRSVYKKIDCSFCDRSDCTNKEYDKCMEEISAEDVVGLADKLI